MQSTREPKFSTFMNVALALAKQSSCIRRHVGCVLTDKYHRIIGTGYNGTHRGASHCIDSPCAGAGLPSTTGLELCEAIHAEQNALMMCHDVMQVDSCFVTVSPCLHCMKMLLNTTCREIYYLQAYDEVAVEMWRLNKRSAFNVVNV